MIKCGNCNKDIIVGFKLEFFTDHCNYEIQDSNALCLDCAKDQNFVIDLLKNMVVFNKEGNIFKRELI